MTTTPADMPNYTAPLGRLEERRLRSRAKTRLYKLVNLLLEYDSDTLLALHEAIDGFYADTIDLRHKPDDDQ